MAPRARLAFLGTGGIAAAHAEAAAVCGAEIVAVANHRSEGARAFAERFGVARWSTDWRAVAADPDVDAVVVCTPNALHADQTIHALEAGKAVLVEKPMAVTLQEGTAMLAAAERTERLLVVAHCWRYDPAVRSLRERIAAGELGRVVRTHGYGLHLGWGPTGWFTDPALSGGGALLDMGIHAIDTTRYLLGDPGLVRAVGSWGTAFGDYAVDDDGVALIDWEGGVRSIVEWGWWQPHMGGVEADVEVFGTAGYARAWPVDAVDHMSPTLYVDQLRDFLDRLAGRAGVPGGATGVAGHEALRVIDALSRSG